jgi:transposase
VIQDGAKYHTSAAMVAFFTRHQDQLRVEQLPTYSPDYNPIEKLWKRIKETEPHLHYFPTFESLVTKVEQAIARFQNTQEEILALCGLREAA